MGRLWVREREEKRALVPFGLTSAHSEVGASGLTRHAHAWFPYLPSTLADMQSAHALAAYMAHVRALEHFTHVRLHLVGTADPACDQPKHCFAVSHICP